MAKTHATPYRFPSLPQELERRAAELLRDHGAVRSLLLQIARIEELRIVTMGHLTMVVADETRSLDAESAARVIDALEAYAKGRANQATDDILDG